MKDLTNYYFYIYAALNLSANQLLVIELDYDHVSKDSEEWSGGLKTYNTTILMATFSYIPKCLIKNHPLVDISCKFTYFEVCRTTSG